MTAYRLWLASAQNRRLRMIRSRIRNSKREALVDETQHLRISNLAHCGGCADRFCGHLRGAKSKREEDRIHNGVKRGERLRCANRESDRDISIWTRFERPREEVD